MKESCHYALLISGQSIILRDSSFKITTSAHLLCQKLVLLSSPFSTLRMMTGRTLEIALQGLRGRG